MTCRLNSTHINTTGMSEADRDLAIAKSIKEVVGKICFEKMNEGWFTMRIVVERGTDTLLDDEKMDFCKIGVIVQE